MTATSLATAGPDTPIASVTRQHPTSGQIGMLRGSVTVDERALSVAATGATRLRWTILIGFLILGVGVGGLGTWAAMAPIHGAVQATGRLVPEGGRKTVKHPDGGIIGQVLVADGDHVAAGAVLVRLDPVAASARLEAINADIRTRRAQEARLLAELSDRDAIVWPEDLRNAIDLPQVARLMADQSGLFAARRGQQRLEEALLAERIQALADEADSMEGQRRAFARERELLGEEMAVTRQLMERGNAPRNRLLDQQKDDARLVARDHELRARVAQIRQAATEARSTVERRREERRERLLVDLGTTRTELTRLREDQRQAANQLRNRDVVAPDSGIVVGLGSRVGGSVVAPNETIADIVPADRSLLAEVRVASRDIRDVRPGLPVEVVLGAFDSRTLGAVDGTVVHVSADLVAEADQRAPSYLVRVRLDQEPGAGLPPNVHLIPGMPVEAQILMSARTPLDYLLSPIRQSYRAAFTQP